MVSTELTTSVDAEAAPVDASSQVVVSVVVQTPSAVHNPAQTECVPEVRLALPYAAPLTLPCFTTP